MTKHEVRRVRKALGFSQSKFAALLGVRKLTVLRWEAGHFPVSGPAERLIRLLDKHRKAPAKRKTTRRRRTR